MKSLFTIRVISKPYRSTALWGGVGERHPGKYDVIEKATGLGLPEGLICESIGEARAMKKIMEQEAQKKIAS